MPSQASHPYEKLTPDLVMDAVESLDILSDQRVFPLNSYENRVYQVGIEDSQPIIVKFYRPGRWSDAAILEEHSFSQELVDADISVVAPNKIAGQTLHEYEGFRFALFTRQGGHAPEIGCEDTLFRLGRTIGRMHQTGTREKFQFRRSISIEIWGQDNADFLISENIIPSSLMEAYSTLSTDLIQKMRHIWGDTPFETTRLHGDSHLGNILWRDNTAHFVDLDDCINGPAIQDLWLMLSGDRPQQTQQIMEIIEGYQEFCEFDPRQLRLIETLRTLRMINYAAWLARRWEDPAFPMHFPWFNTERYWAQHILELREQLANLDEEPLKLANF